MLVNNRVMGSLQLFSKAPNTYDKEDAQLLWTLARVAENLLARERANEGLIHFAFTDHLTGLRSRGYFEQQLDLLGRDLVSASTTSPAFLQCLRVLPDFG